MDAPTVGKQVTLKSGSRQTLSPGDATKCSVQKEKTNIKTVALTWMDVTLEIHVAALRQTLPESGLGGK